MTYLLRKLESGSHEECVSIVQSKNLQRLTGKMNLELDKALRRQRASFLFPYSLFSPTRDVTINLQDKKTII